MFLNVSIEGECKINLKSKTASKFVLDILSYACFWFSLKMSILTNFLKNHKFHMFANFRIKILPNVAKFGFILKKAFPSMIFHEKESDLHKRSKLFKIPKFSGKLRTLPMIITPEPNMLET